ESVFASLAPVLVGVKPKPLIRKWKHNRNQSRSNPRSAARGAGRDAVPALVGLGEGGLVAVAEGFGDTGHGVATGAQQVGGQFHAHLGQDVAEAGVFGPPRSEER